MSLIEKLHPLFSKFVSPIEVRGDGNCFYRAVSLGVFSTEEHHLLIRLISAIELIENRLYYDPNCKGFIDIVNDVSIRGSIQYEDSVERALHIGGYADMLNFYAASCIIDTPLLSYYPPTRCYHTVSVPHTRKVVGRGVKHDTNAAAHLMWTQTSVPLDLNKFSPNHFVILLQSETKSRVVVDLTSNLHDQSSSSCIPIGLKENVYYVIDNSQKIDRRAKGQRSDFTDDCGAWLPGGPTTKSYIISGPNDERKSIQMHKNVFCTMKRVGKGKRIHVPLDPQPDPSTVIALHRYYRKLKASDKYTRRISWLSVGSSDHTKACAEYLGEFPGLMPHGNSKTDQVGYKRTAATVLDAIGQELEKTKSVLSTFGKLQNEAMSTMQPRPRNSKQVENKKYNDAKAKRDELGPNIVGSNLADHFQHILSVTHSN